MGTIEEQVKRTLGEAPPPKQEPRQSDSDRPVYPPPSAPLEVARTIFRQFRNSDGLRTLVSCRNSWIRWCTTHWQEMDTAELRSLIYKTLGKADYLADDAPTPWNPNKRKVADVMEAMAACGHLSTDVEPPSWLGVQAKTAALQMISCRNGLLDLSTRELVRHTPALYNVVSVPFDYAADAPEPQAWLEFLSSVWPDDGDSVALLQQYIGYAISGRTDMQKLLLLIGPTRSGKGTIARMLTDLIGRLHVAGPTLASLGTNFGLSPLLGKPLAIISDARLGDTPAHSVVERLLSITGEDTLTIDRKFRDPWSGRIPTRFVILSNELPRFRDASAAIAHRMLILQMTRSFLGREDRTLDARLREELPGILVWALQGLDRLVLNGRFTVPSSSDDAANLMLDLASPVSAFVRDCCIRKPEESVARDALFDAWKTWAEDNGHQAGAKSTFGRNLRAVVPELRDSQPIVNGMRVRQYDRIGLIPAHQRTATYTLNGVQPVPPVPSANGAGQHADGSTTEDPSTLFQPPTTGTVRLSGTGHPVPAEQAKGQVRDHGTGGTGQRPFKAQHENSNCAEAGPPGRRPGCVCANHPNPCHWCSLAAASKQDGS
ncbi:DNA primase family protein [Mycobacterium marinum]|uniref:DNA primase family protein n=1 Tax=Mycobacterium marinum TaxID=1781 RepID=UPI00045FCDD9|nr:phage/plasmid primase, P4 family [Mycobacterium marinum]CDM76127.1 hypothetical protein MMARE11_19800 [Mycobacterium marinum E11]